MKCQRCSKEFNIEDDANITFINGDTKRREKKPISASKCPYCKTIHYIKWKIDMIWTIPIKEESNE